MQVGIYCMHCVISVSHCSHSVVSYLHLKHVDYAPPMTFFCVSCLRITQGLPVCCVKFALNSGSLCIFMLEDVFSIRVETLTRNIIMLCSFFLST